MDSLYNPDYVKNIVKYTNKGIPKIIHQIWINENNSDGPPEHWIKGPEEWKKTHSDYIYILWDKENSIDFINKYFPEYLDIYNNFQHVIQRCNMIRYMFLYKYGGIYCDLDNYPKENLEKYLNKDVKLYVVEKNYFMGIKSVDINLIITSTENIVFEKMLSYIKNTGNITYNSTSEAVFNTDGLNILYEHIKNNHEDVYILPYEFFGPFSIEEEEFKDSDKIIIMSTRGGSWYDNNMNFLIFFKKNYMLILCIILILIIFIVLLYLNFIPKDQYHKINQ